MPITYRTVIDKAINDFNAIQNALSVHKAKYNSEEIKLTTASDTVLVPTDQLSAIVQNQLQLIPTALYTATGPVSDLDIKHYGSLTVPAVTMGDISTSENTDGSLKVSSSVTKAGWISSDSRTITIAKAEFTVDGGSVKSSKAGYVSKGQTLGTAGEGSVSSSATITGTTLAAGTSGITLADVKPTGTAETDYFTLKPYATASSSMTLVPGYITQKGTEGTAASTTLKTYYVNKATVSVNNPTFTITPTIGNATTTTGISGNIKLASTNGAFVTTQPTSGKYIAVKSAQDSGNDTVTASFTEGYTKEGTATGEATYTLNSSTYYVKVKEGSVDIAANQEVKVDGASVTASGKTLSISGSKTANVSIKKEEGYIDGGTANSTSTIKASISKTVDLTTLDANLLAANIKSGVSIFGIVGTYLAPSFDSNPSGNIENSSELRYIAVTTDDAHGGKETHYHSEDMLAGAVAYIDNKPVYGMMNDFSIANDGTAKNKYGASGSGTLVATTDVALSGTTLTSKLNSTGYIKGGISHISVTVPTEEKTVTASNETQTVTPSSGKLLTKVTVNAMTGATFNGATLTPTQTKVTAAITGATKNIQSDVVLNPETVSGYMVRVNLSGSATPTTASNGYTHKGQSNGTVSIADNSHVDIQIRNSNPDAKYFMSSGTSSFKAIEQSGYVDGTKYLKGGSVADISGQSIAITNNSTHASKSGDAAVVSDNVTGDYVVVNATGKTGSVAVSQGWVESKTVASKDLSDSARIAAVVNPTVTAGTPSVTVSTSGYTTYANSGSISTRLSATDQTATINAVTVLNASTNYKDKYVVGTFTAKTNSGTATVKIGADVTGSNVDEAVQSLYQRMLGVTYTPVKDEFPN